MSSGGLRSRAFGLRTGDLISPAPLRSAGKNPGSASLRRGLGLASLGHLTKKCLVLERSVDGRPLDTEKLANLLVGVTLGLELSDLCTTAYGLR